MIGWEFELDSILVSIFCVWNTLHLKILQKTYDNVNVLLGLLQGLGNSESKGPWSLNSLSVQHICLDWPPILSSLSSSKIFPYLRFSPSSNKQALIYSMNMKSWHYFALQFLPHSFYFLYSKTIWKCCINFTLSNSSPPILFKSTTCSLILHCSCSYQVHSELNSKSYLLPLLAETHNFLTSVNGNFILHLRRPKILASSLIPLCSHTNLRKSF